MNQKKKRLIILAILSGVILLIGCIGTYGYFNYAVNEKLEGYTVLEPTTTGVAFKAIQESEQSISDMSLVAENDQFKLYVNETTTIIAVFDKRSKQSYFSSPVNYMDDAIANPVNKSYLGSAISLTYYDAGRALNTMHSEKDSVANGNFTIESIEMGVRVTYTLGDQSTGIEALPKFITEERLEEKVLSKLDAKTAKTVKKNYAKSKNKEGYLEIRSSVSNSKIILEQMLDAFLVAGYTSEDLAVDNGSDVVVDSGSKPQFTIPIEYTLVDDGLVASIHTQNIIESPNEKIAQIEMLKFMGAGSTEDSGYLVVPNGSGSLIYFNNNKKAGSGYEQKIYDIDPVIASFNRSEITQPARLPLFGIKRNDGGILATISKGDGLATVIADVSGKTNGYNFANAQFAVRDSEALSMFGTEGGEADLPVVEKDLYKGTLAIHYAFLTKENANYSGMARIYQSQLVDEGVLSKPIKETMPFYLDILGGIEKKMFIAGIPYQSSYSMTSFDEAGQIAVTMHDKGVANIKLRYLGWFNDGFYHDVARDVHIMGKTGGKKDLKELNQTLEAIGGKLFLDVAFEKVSGKSDNFMPSFEASRYISGISVQNAPYDRALNRMFTRYDEAVSYLVSPKALLKHIDGFLNSYEIKAMSNLSLRDLGDTLASDKKRTDTINRQVALSVAKEGMSRLSEMSKQTMISGGNGYGFAYATDLINIPMGDNSFYVIDEEVPLYQMIIHGFINYSGSEYNLNPQQREIDVQLKMIEFGIAPRFVFTEKPTYLLKNTSLDWMYSTESSIWMDEAVETYAFFAKALDSVQGLKMIDRVEVAQQVWQIVYENEHSIYVNYSNNDYSHQGVLVKAHDYTVVEGDNK